MKPIHLAILVIVLGTVGCEQAQEKTIVEDAEGNVQPNEKAPSKATADSPTDSNVDLKGEDYERKVQRLQLEIKKSKAHIMDLQVRKSELDAKVRVVQATLGEHGMKALQEGAPGMKGIQEEMGELFDDQREAGLELRRAEEDHGGLLEEIDRLEPQ